MGMYTELHYNAVLKENTPKEVLDALNYMLSRVRGPEPELPDHPLFLTERWRIMLRCDSAYFEEDTCSTFDPDTRVLSIQCNFKNYDDELEKFTDWIAPYLETPGGKLLGHQRYEEAEDETYIYAPNTRLECPGKDH